MDFRGTNETDYVGICVSLDYSLSDVTINNITCNRTYFGIGIQMGSFDTRKCPSAPPVSDVSSTLFKAPLQSPLTLPSQSQQFARNILVSNYTANSAVNAGFLNFDNTPSSIVTNLTYSNVTVLGGDTLGNYYYTRFHCRDGLINNSAPQNFTNIWFKSFHGNLGHTPYACSDYACLGCWSRAICDFHFEDFPHCTGKPGCCTYYGCPA